MSPLEKIKEWMKSANQEVVSEIHYYVLMYLTDDRNISSEEYAESFDKWLSDEGPMYTNVIGKALSFREVVDFSSRDRFTNKVWDRATEYHKEIVEKYKDTTDEKFQNMAPRSQAMIDDMPRRAAIWAEFGKEWRLFADRELSTEALEEYQESEMFKSVDEIRNRKPVKIDLRRS